METLHAEGESPFVVREGVAAQEADQSAIMVPGDDDADSSVKYEMCQVDGCDEWLLATEMEDHLQLHVDEAELDSISTAPKGDATAASSRVTDLDTSADGHYTPAARTPLANAEPSIAPRHRSHDKLSQPNPPRKDSPTRRQAHAINIWRNILNMPLAKNKATPPSEIPAVQTRGKRLGVSSQPTYCTLSCQDERLISDDAAASGAWKVCPRAANARLARLAAPQRRASMWKG
jgi:hypothetical protein